MALGFLSDSGACVKELQMHQLAFDNHYFLPVMPSRRNDVQQLACSLINPSGDILVQCTLAYNLNIDHYHCIIFVTDVNCTPESFTCSLFTPIREQALV